MASGSLAFACPYLQLKRFYYLVEMFLAADFFPVFELLCHKFGSDGKLGLLPLQ
jgi:hypothetical protein